MSQLARLGFLLLGLKLILEPLAQLSSQFRVSDGTSFAAFATTLGWWCVFGLLPGAVLALRSRAFAEALFPPREGTPEWNIQSLATAGIVVLGAYLIVRGLAGIGTAAVMVLILRDQSASLAGNWAGSGVQWALELGFGVVLISRATPIAAFLLRRKPEAAA